MFNFNDYCLKEEKINLKSYNIYIKEVSEQEARQTKLKTGYGGYYAGQKKTMNSRQWFGALMYYNYYFLKTTYDKVRSNPNFNTVIIAVQSALSKAGINEEIILDQLKKIEEIKGVVYGSGQFKDFGESIESSEKQFDKINSIKITKEGISVNENLKESFCEKFEIDFKDTSEQFANFNENTINNFYKEIMSKDVHQGIEPREGINYLTAFISFLARPFWEYLEKKISRVINFRVKYSFPCSFYSIFIKRICFWRK